MLLLMVRSEIWSIRDLAKRSRARSRLLRVHTIELPRNMIRQLARLLTVSSRRTTAALVGLRASTAAVVELEWRDLRLLRILLFAFAGTAHEREPIRLGLLRREAVALTMLPDAAPIAGDAVGAIVHVLAVLPADGTVEVPSTFVFREGLEFFLVLFLLGLALSFGGAFGVSCVTVHLVRSCAVTFLFQLRQFFFVQDPLGLSFAYSLFSGQSP